MDKFIEWFKSLNFEFLSIIGAIIYFIVIIYTIFKIIKNTVNPSKAIGYLLIVVILPIIGVILYFSIGMNYRLEKLYKRKYTHDRNFYQIIRNEIN